MNIAVPKGPLTVLEMLERSGYEAYFVGGCVRDNLLGRQPGDWDVATNARPEQVAVCFGDFSVIGTGIRHGTVTVIAEKMPVEVTTFRVDGPYSDSRRPDSVVFVDKLREDLARRDFTVNAMAYHPSSGIVDYFGGMADLRARRLACVGDPVIRFSEDALRVLRAVRFASVLCFEVEPDTAAAMEIMAPPPGRVAAERVRAELDKALMGSGLERAFDVHAAVIARILPELAPVIKSGAWGDALAAVQRAEPLLAVRLALLFGEGAETALDRLRYDNVTRRRAQSLINFRAADLMPEPPEVRRWLNRLGEDGLRMLIAHHRARWPDRPLDSFERLLDTALAEGQCYSLAGLAVGGGDILGLGIPHGKAVGEALAALLDGVIDDRLPNERLILIDEAIKLAKLDKS